MFDKCSSVKSFEANSERLMNFFGELARSIYLFLHSLKSRRLIFDMFIMRTAISRIWRRSSCIDALFYSIVLSVLFIIIFDLISFMSLLVTDAAKYWVYIRVRVLFCFTMTKCASSVVQNILHFNNSVIFVFAKCAKKLRAEERGLGHSTPM